MKSAQTSANTHGVLAEAGSPLGNVGGDEGGSSGSREELTRNPRAFAGPPLLLRANEVAHLLGLGRSKVYELMQSGELPTVRIGTAIRVPMNALTDWVKDRTDS